MTTELAVLISGSPSPNSKSRRLLAHAEFTLERSGFETIQIDLHRLRAAGLLGREQDRDIAGGRMGHLALDQGMRPLFASVGATVVSCGVYGCDAQFRGGIPDAELVERVERAVEEAVRLSRAALTSAVEST